MNQAFRRGDSDSDSSPRCAHNGLGPHRTDEFVGFPLAAGFAGPISNVLPSPLGYRGSCLSEDRYSAYSGSLETSRENVQSFDARCRRQGASWADLTFDGGDLNDL